MLQKIFADDKTSAKKRADAPEVSTYHDKEVEMHHAIVSAMADAVGEIRNRNQMMALQDCIF